MKNKPLVTICFHFIKATTAHTDSRSFCQGPWAHSSWACTSPPPCLSWCPGSHFLCRRWVFLQYDTILTPFYIRTLFRQELSYSWHFVSSSSICSIQRRESLFLFGFSLSHFQSNNMGQKVSGCYHIQLIITTEKLRWMTFLLLCEAPTPVPHQVLEVVWLTGDIHLCELLTLLRLGKPFL